MLAMVRIVHGGVLTRDVVCGIDWDSVRYGQELRLSLSAGTCPDITWSDVVRVVYESKGRTITWSVQLTQRMGGEVEFQAGRLNCSSPGIIVGNRVPLTLHFRPQGRRRR